MYTLNLVRQPLSRWLLELCYGPPPPSRLLSTEDTWTCVASLMATAAAEMQRAAYLAVHHLQAYTLGLMDEEGLQQVAVEAMTALRRARTRYAFEKQIDWAQIIRQLNQDLRSANAILPDHMQISPIAIPDPVAISQTLSRSTELDVQ